MRPAHVLGFSLSLLLTACAEAPPPKTAAAPVDADAERRAIGAMLDDWHAAAAQADETRYFGHFTKDAIFLGTDATERWDLAGFRAFAHPYFEKGKAWSFRATRRGITVAADGQTAWFDEDLHTGNLGPSRGSGTIVREGQAWKIAHYDLSIPIPNDRVKDIVERIAAPPLVKLRDRYKAMYQKASTVALEDVAEADKVLAALVPEAKAHPDEDVEFWLHNELTWLKWAQDDLPGALAEADAMRVTLDHGTLPAKRTAELRLHERWDRAYILLEMALAAPRDKRAKALAAANDARASYQALAMQENDPDGLAALETFFAARQGKTKEAVAFAKKVDIAKRDDVQDLYIFQLAYEAGGDKPSMEATRAKICGTKNYLMRPLILRRGAKEGWKCR
ncbi:nuclear transport factor 2 family protein [Pendulispora rubella]|uniref:Nuclear transport factor 2 family protein n=1 Tax=Pendulispora rubella TaxID=2741070 RepID=A0ABZ2L8J3_9BACT